MHFRKSILDAVIIACLLTLTQTAHATSYSAAHALLGNPAVSPAGLATLDAHFHIASPDVASVAGSATFSGINGSGDNASMTFDYSALSQTTATGVKAYASATLTNGFYNAHNPAYLSAFDTTWGGVIDPNGVPTYFEANGMAYLSNRLAIAGAADLSYITYDIDVHGAISGSVSSNLTSETRFNTNNYSVNFFDSIDQTFNSGRINVSSGYADIEMFIAAVIQFNLEGDDLFSEQLLESTVDFFNTATITTFYGFDAYGNPVDLISVTGSDGTSYDTFRTNIGTNVPEPESLALVGLALGLLGAYRKKYQSNS